MARAGGVARHRRPIALGFTALGFTVEPRLSSTKAPASANLMLDGRRLSFKGDPHGPEAPTHSPRAPTIVTDPLLAAPFERGCADLDRLALPGDGGVQFIAAGAPWFLALFGRDTLVTSLMSGLLGTWHVKGALAALAATQARASDDFRDAQPGKIAHELRQGELARFHRIPHTPYYGTHDAPALFVLALWNAFRWTGDRGYRNQGWKDAGDAIPHEDGTRAESPIATVELQGYWYAARWAMAELLEAIGRPDRAEALRAAADRLRRLIEDRFWIEAAGCYALALDGRKQPVRSIASNAGHLLWCGVPSPERARRVARRLLAEDTFSGYGVRTLASTHRRYNPLSYQLGSVWPHDNALFAAGLARYGLFQEAARVFEGLLAAAGAFEQNRLPELFCGFAREQGAPVPYEKANVPQAWAAAGPILAAQVFLGLVPDVANGRCHLSPWLPEWLSSLTIRGIEVGAGSLDVKLAREGSRTELEYARHPNLRIVIGAPAAPLWGALWTRCASAVN